MPARKPRPLSVSISGPDKGGRYHGFVQVGTKANGKPDRRHRSGATRHEVERKLREVESGRDAGRRIPAGQPWTVAQWLGHWLENIVRTNLRVSTYNAYRPLVVEHIVPAIGGRRLSGSSNLLSAEDIDLVYARMRQAKKSDGSARYAPSYIHGCHRVLRRALKLAYKRGRASQDFSALIEAPRGGKRRKVKAHDLDETRQLVEAIGRSDCPARWMVGVMLGLRQGEVLGLAWDRVHLDARVPHISVTVQAQRRTWQHGCADPHACATAHCRTKPCGPSWGHGCGGTCERGNPRCCPKRIQVHCKRHKSCPPPCRPDCTRHAVACPQRRDGGIHLVDLKSDESHRHVELPPALVQALRAQRQRQLEQRLKAGPRWRNRGLVFCESDGAATDKRRDHERWEALLRDAGLPDAPLHAARHTAATMLLMTGADVRVVQSILGHADIRVTEIYTDVAAELRKQALERMADQLFGGALLPGSATTPR